MDKVAATVSKLVEEAFAVDETLSIYVAAKRVMTLHPGSSFDLVSDLVARKAMARGLSLIWERQDGSEA